MVVAVVVGVSVGVGIGIGAEAVGGGKLQLWTHFNWPMIASGTCTANGARTDRLICTLPQPTEKFAQ